MTLEQKAAAKEYILSIGIRAENLMEEIEAGDMSADEVVERLDDIVAFTYKAANAIAEANKS